MQCFTTLSTELKKVAILAIRIGERSGNLGNIFTRNLRRFVKFWDMSRFTHFWDHFQAECGEDFEWLKKLGNIDLKILLFCLHFPPKFLYGSNWGIFWWIVCNNMKITLFCRFDYWTRFTHFGEHFWPTVLDWGTLLHFFQLCLSSNATYTHLSRKIGRNSYSSPPYSTLRPSTRSRHCCCSRRMNSTMFSPFSSAISSPENFSVRNYHKIP